MENLNNTDKTSENAQKELRISDVISRLLKLNRYDCDIDIDEVEETCHLITQSSKTGRFVKWSDIEGLLNDL
jgi:hypothetical protein